MTEDQFITVKGAREHNLKNIDVKIPKNKLIVFSGVSGSGKSSLAFDTIYAEGQRRYVESLSTYARQFLGVMDKPDVDSIEGLSPAISIDQKTASRNPRSTVGTITEIYDYLRLLFARVGHPHCPVCGREIKKQGVEQIVDSLINLIKEKLTSRKNIRFLILSPVVRDKKGEFSSLLSTLRSKGYQKARIDGKIYSILEDIYLIKTNRHSIEVVVDNFSLAARDIKDPLFLGNLRGRLFDSVSQSLSLSLGRVIFSEVKDKGFEMPEFPTEFEDSIFSELFACPFDNIQISEIEPRTFSFNSPHGACNYCNGLGVVRRIDPEKIISPELSISEGAILPFARLLERQTWYARLVLKVCQENGIDIRKPIKYLPQEKVDILLYGTEGVYEVKGLNRWGRETIIWERFTGFVSELERRYKETDSEFIKEEIDKFMKEEVCPECKGTRLKKESLSVTIDGLSIADVSSLSIENLHKWISNLIDGDILTPQEKKIGSLVLKEISKRLEFLISVGVEYLSLDRSATSLSGGEAQRIRLASQIGSGLTGVLYVLDEPTIGLHPKDTQKLITTLQRLRDLGNTVIVVEHDRETIESADYIFDFGPQAGENGGRIISQGTPEDIKNDKNSITGFYLSRRLKLFQSKIQLAVGDNKGEILLYGCKKHNLKNINVSFPLGKLVVVTGVSGSGKSSLVVDTLYPALKYFLEDKILKRKELEFEDLEIKGDISKVVLVDQSPIGKTPRSNPATYTKVFDLIRDVFALTKEAKLAGLKKGHFSFNVKGGRCEACQGQGQIKIEMQFMNDVWITCDVCKGRRYNSQVLDVNFRGKNISEVLDMSVDEAIDHFHSYHLIINKLNVLKDVGLSYIHLGQPAPTLSGGESQRVKLALELSKNTRGGTVFILDEPTTGLHFADIEKLISVLRRLVDMGNSVFVIEHNLDVIRSADYIIDLGPEGGERGGYIVASGKPEEIKENHLSYTAAFL